MHRTTCILTASGNLPPPRPAILPQILQSMNQMNVAFRWRGTSKVMSRPLSPQDETTLRCTLMTRNKQVKMTRFRNSVTLQALAT